MAVRFKGISEYKKKFKGRRSRSRSASPQVRMRQAGLRSDQLGITREPQFLSKRRVPIHDPQVSQSFQWDGSVESPRQQQTPSSSRPPAAAPSAGGAGNGERAETPLAPRSPRPSGSLHAEPRSPAAAEGAEFTQNGVQHALKRRAGLKSAHTRGFQSSEYQRQFMWKAPAMSSPLLDAEQMVYSSSPVIPPFKVNPVVQESEYRRSFKGSPPPRGPRLRQDMEEQGGSPLHLERVSPERAKKSTKKKRKQLSRKLSQNGLPQCGLQSQQQEVRSQSPHESPLPSHGGYRKVKSEYDSNFRSPLLYRFKDGEWVKSSTAGEEGCDSHTWYRELRELREKAKAYRRRAWGTHFSREHLNQILSEQNQLWEASTMSSSATTEHSGASSRTIQALDLASCSSGSVRRSPSDVGSMPRTPSASRRSSGECTGDPELRSSPTLPVQRKLAWGEVGPEAGPGQVGGNEEGREEEPQIGRTQEEEEQDQEDEERNNRVTVPEGQSPEPSTSNSQSSVQRGRLATPKMKTFSTIQRTHHDLTTPATGGAILVSPPKLKDSSWRKSMRRSEPPLGKPHSPHKPMFRGSPESVSSKGKESSQPYTSPAAGVTTLDPIPLREEPRPVHPSPPPHLARTSHRPGPDAPLPSVRVLTNCIHGTLRDPEFQHNGNLGFIRHGEPVFTSNDSDASDNDDRMSQMSARSAASCSLASQILERAQKRRKNFWGKS